MHESTPREYDKGELDRLLTEMHSLIPGVVRQACCKLGHHFDKAKLEDFADDLLDGLIKDDLHTLRSFQGQSAPATWLFTIAERIIVREIERGKRQESVEDQPQVTFIVQPKQEDKLLAKEIVEFLNEMIVRLTPHQRDLFSLVRSEATNKEIAQQLGITVASVAVERSQLMHKLEKLGEEILARHKGGTN